MVELLSGSAVWLWRCGTHRILELRLIHMLLLQQLCSTLLDQMGGVQTHFALLLEPYQLLFQLATPDWSKNIVNDCVTLLLQASAHNWGYGSLEALQRYSAQPA